MAATSNMFLYSLSIQPPTAITQAIVGQFSGTKEQQILTASGSRLALYLATPSLGKIQMVISHDVFSTVRSIASFRPAGSTKDYIIVASDSGRIAILEYMVAQNRFSRMHPETFGRSGVRRVIPGQYLAADPKGRACLMASIEKNKVLYVLNRNAQAELTISSPLEAHMPGALVFSLVALDVGYANPVFAALEANYSDSDQDTTGQSYPDIELVYYELDLGLNHVIRAWSDPVERTATLLFQVPGGNDGPSGVLVCAEGSISYRHSNQKAFRVPIPRRRGTTEDPQRKRIIVSGVMHKLKNNAGAFFFLLQSEDGDLFKITFDIHEDSEGRSTGEVRRIKIKYFDTVPIASSLCILKSGFLFVASEFGNHHLYQFEQLGDDDKESEFISDDFPPEPETTYQPVYFYPRPLENLTLVENIDSMNPLLDSKVLNLSGDDAPEIYSVCGTGARSYFQVLKHGIETDEVVVSELPGTVSAVWTTKLASQDKYDAYIILTSSNDTLVLSIGEEVKQVDDSGFLTSVNTLAIQQIGDNGLVQIYPKGIRHIREGKVNEWPVPQHRSIVATATNEQQLVVALSSGEIVYFEVDNDGSLAEYGDKKKIDGTITCLGLGQVPKGRQRSSLLAVGCDDCTVRILSLDPETTLESRSVQALTAAPSALRIIVMEDSVSSGSRSYLHIGLNSGVYIRTMIDELTGELTDTRHRFLGINPVKLFPIIVEGQSCILALSSRPWVGYINPARGFMMTPLNYENFEWASNFSSEQCEEGIVGVHANYLRIFSVVNLRENMTRKSVPLTYTPRRFVKHPEGPYFYTIESENNTLGPDVRKKLHADPNREHTEEEILPPEDFGYPRGSGWWASCISIVDPFGERVLQKVELEGNEAAFSIAVVSFSSQGDESFLVIGTGKDVVVSPRKCSEGYIHVYRFLESGEKLEFIHKTKVEEPPMALLAFHGQLATGIGKVLRIYDLGMKQMLRKAQLEVATQIVTLHTQGNRIVIGDVQQGVIMVVYAPESNKLVPFVDDTVARWTSCTAMLDYDSVVGGDKFGNIWIVRCPERVSLEAEEAGNHLFQAPTYLNGAPYRLDLVAHFFTQDIPTSIHKTRLIVGGQDVLVWTGLQGTIGVLIPFVAREDVDFFQTLEMHMRSESPSLVGRDHLMYRSYYVPVKGVIDGDLCEQYRLLPIDKQQTIATELDRSVREVLRKISDFRTQSSF